MTSLIKQTGVRSMELVENGIFLLASLAWYDLIKYSFNSIYKLKKDNFLNKLLYSIFMTIISVIILLIIDKIQETI